MGAPLYGDRAAARAGGDRDAARPRERVLLVALETHPFHGHRFVDRHGARREDGTAEIGDFLIRVRAAPVVPVLDVVPIARPRLRPGTLAAQRLHDRRELRALERHRRGTHRGNEVPQGVKPQDPAPLLADVNVSIGRLGQIGGLVERGAGEGRAQRELPERRVLILGGLVAQHLVVGRVGHEQLIGRGRAEVRDLVHCEQIGVVASIHRATDVERGPGRTWSWSATSR